MTKRLFGLRFWISILLLAVLAGFFWWAIGYYQRRSEKIREFDSQLTRLTESGKYEFNEEVSLRRAKALAEAEILFYVLLFAIPGTFAAVALALIFYSSARNATFGTSGLDREARERNAELRSNVQKHFAAKPSP